MKDLFDTVALFSEIYAWFGMNINLFDIDSPGFWLEIDNELYDRIRIIHTTFIPYKEYRNSQGY